MRMVVGIVTAAVLAGLSGCGGGGPKLVNVTGTVTLNGKPLSGADIVFTPDQSTKDAFVGSDVTGPEGNFKVMSNGRAGVAPGKYKVIVSKSLVQVTSVPDEFKEDPYMMKLA